MGDLGDFEILSGHVVDASQLVPIFNSTSTCKSIDPRRRLTIRSRLIFRNLPPSLNIDTFKTSLQSPPSLKTTQITDTKLVAKRRFAFVGYKTEEEAKKVRDWFDGSFEFGNVKVKVELVNDEVSVPTYRA